MASNQKSDSVNKLKNNPAKFYWDTILNDGALGFLSTSPQEVPELKRDQFLIQKKDRTKAIYLV